MQSLFPRVTQKGGDFSLPSKEVSAEQALLLLNCGEQF